MLASASGPLGALLVIAPLAAIPVVAIVGIPQFAPVAASPSDEEDIGEIVDSNAAPAAVRPARRRSADDLFAPLPGRSGMQPEGKGYASVYGNSSRTTPGDSGFPGIGDNWEVVAADPGVASDHREENRLDVPNQRPQPSTAGEVSPQGFKPGLLPPNSRESNATRLDDLARGGSALDRNPGNPGRQDDPRGSVDLANGSGLEAMAQMMSEQSRWQAVSTRIKELRIQKYRLEARIEEPRFVFRCVFAPAESSQVTQLFEADAETPIEAVEQVLQQVDEWLQSHDQTAALLLD